MKFFSLICVVIVMTGCSTTKCKDRLAGVVVAQKTESLNAEVASVKKVKIFKADGTLQCKQGKLIPLESMAKELSGIQIFSSANLNDGMMRIQLCGKPTGQSNVYEINESDLDKALALGFKKWAQK